MNGMNNGKLFGIMAHPVHHSLSPLMHNAAFRALDLPCSYHAFDIHPDQLTHAVQAIKTLQLGGVNVSIPHKEKICALLDEMDEEAIVIGAVNTVVHDNGRLKGFNTDGEGYVRSLLADTNVNLATANILLLGAGGASKAIGVYLLKLGATSLSLANRTLDRALHLQKQLQNYKNDAHILSIKWEDLTETKLGDFTLIINTTPIGMWPNVQEQPIALYGIEEGTIVSDIVYNPLRTAFLQQGERFGAIVHEGLGMFIYQGALAFKLFTGIDAPIEMMKETVLKQLQRGGNK